MLTDREKATLLDIARAALQSQAQGGDAAALPRPAHLTEPLEAPRGAFVSYHRLDDGRLRGCVGLVQPLRPLWEAVREMAVAAASRDARFAPLKAEEVAGLDIEVSALSPLEPCRGPADVQVGTHGLSVRAEGHSGLLLPQVAAHYGWDAATFLGETCRKARLPREAWRGRGVELLRFRCEVFSGPAVLAS